MTLASSLAAVQLAVEKGRSLDELPATGLTPVYSAHCWEVFVGNVFVILNESRVCNCPVNLDYENIDEIVLFIKPVRHCYRLFHRVAVRQGIFYISGEIRKWRVGLFETVHGQGRVVFFCAPLVVVMMVP